VDLLEDPLLLGSVAFVLGAVAIGLVLALIGGLGLVVIGGRTLRRSRPPPPPPTLIKQVACRICGQAKGLPSQTPYLYCDHCGALVDWDFRLACERGLASPGPAYEALQAAEKPRQEAARAGNDRATYAASVRMLFDAHFSACPSSWSPRLGDPSYRVALLEHIAEHYTAAAFDYRCKVLETAMNDAVKRIEWSDDQTATRESFEPLLEAVVSHNQRFVELGADLVHQHPDEPSPELQQVMASSAFARGWMQYLHPEDQDFMIEWLGLGAEYVEAPAVRTVPRTCGGCGTTLRVARGAQRVVCERCGRTLDVGRPPIRCAGCGTPTTAVLGSRSFPCPSCATDICAASPRATELRSD
jgi:hypothetical protein